MTPFTCCNCGAPCDCNYLCPGCSGAVCDRCVHMGNDGRSHEMEMALRTFRCDGCKANKKEGKMDEKLMKRWEPYFEFQRLFLRNANAEQTMLAVRSIFLSGCAAQAVEDREAVKGYCHSHYMSTYEPRFSAFELYDALAAAEIKDIPSK